MTKDIEQSTHWTQRSVADFVYSISSTFMAQLETRMEEKNITRSELASLLHKSNGRVSQLFNNPGNLSLRVIVELTQVLGMKAGIFAYDDGDPANNKGPINPNVFVESWKKLACPADLYSLEKAHASLENQLTTYWTNLLSGAPCGTTIASQYLGTRSQTGYFFQPGVQQTFNAVVRTAEQEEAA